MNKLDKTDIKAILTKVKNVAILGCSDKSYKTSYRVAQYLSNHNYNIYPVNPNHKKSLGKECCNTLFDLPGNIDIDVVTIFRRSRFTADMVDQIIRWSDEKGQKPIIWTQIGVSSPEAEKKAEKAGFTYIRDRCMMADHAALL